MPADILGCLEALRQLQPEPRFDVFIAENGGREGMTALLDALSAETALCGPATEPQPVVDLPNALRQRVFRLVRRDANAEARVHVAEMPENLGYAGAVNAWLRPLLQRPGWRGAWILNPDTEPTPSALAELVDQAARRAKGMVGSRITVGPGSNMVRTRGLAWHKLTARTIAVDRDVCAAVEPDAEDVEARLHAPCGASLYVTRDLIERIGLMDERYFLYFEDLEWGSRAKDLGELGYAHDSIVPHRGGTTIGSADRRGAASSLSVYLESRNRILFVRDRYHTWLAWTVLMQVLDAAAFVKAGSFANALTAVRGSVAGLMGEVGRPDHILKAHET